MSDTKKLGRRKLSGPPSQFTTGQWPVDVEWHPQDAHAVSDVIAAFLQQRVLASLGDAPSPISSAAALHRATDLPESSCEALLRGRRQASLAELLACAFAAGVPPLPGSTDIRSLLPPAYHPWLTADPEGRPALRRPGMPSPAALLARLAAWVGTLPDAAIQFLDESTVALEAVRALHHEGLSAHNAERVRIGRDAVGPALLQWFSPPRLACVFAVIVAGSPQSTMAQFLAQVGLLADLASDQRWALLVADPLGLRRIRDSVSAELDQGTQFVIPWETVVRAGREISPGQVGSDVHVTVGGVAEAGAGLMILLLEVKDR